MNKLKIALRNLKTNKVRTSIYLLLMIIVVSAQVLSFTSYQQFNEKYKDLEYDLRSYIGLGGWGTESDEDIYTKNPYLYNSKVRPTLITEEEYENYKKSDLIENSSYTLETYVVAVAKGTRKDYEDIAYDDIFMYEWEGGDYDAADPDSHPSMHMSIYSIGNKEMFCGKEYECELLEGVDTLSDGEILMGEDDANKLKVTVGDTIQIHQSVYSNGNIMGETDYGFEDMKEYYVDYSLKVVGIYGIDFEDVVTETESGVMTYSMNANNYTTSNTIIEYDELVKKVKNEKDIKNFTVNESHSNSTIDFTLKNPNDKQKLQDELNDKGLNYRYTIFSAYDGRKSDLVPIINVISQLQVACIVITIIAILSFLIMMIYENKKRIKETSILYLLGYSKKDIWLIMFIEKIILLLIAGGIAIIVTNLIMRDFLYYITEASCEHYFVDVMGYIWGDGFVTDSTSLLSWNFGYLPWDSADAFVNYKVSVQPLHFIVLVVTCVLQALLASGWILWKKVSDFDFLGRK